jgi:hypothetical protein
MVRLSTLGFAALVGAVVALVVDVALQAALGSVRSGVQPMVIMGTVVERLRWIVAAGLFCLIAPRWDRQIRNAVDATNLFSPSIAWSLAGMMMIVVPPIWAAATWLVMILRMALAGTWSTNSRIFLEPYFYSDLILSYAPWLLAGVTLLAVRRHVA